MVYAVSERPAVGLSGPMADPEVLSSEDTAKSRLALYCEGRPYPRFYKICWRRNPPEVQGILGSYPHESCKSKQ